MGAKPIGVSDVGTEPPQLAVQGVSKRFGGVTAVENVTLIVRHGEILSIIGPNGAGKTSLLNMISGFYRPTSGAIRLDGRDITRLRPSQVAALGVARTFQNIALFAGMTVLDNIMLGRHVHMRSGVFASLIYWGFRATRGNRPPRTRRGVDRIARTAEHSQTTQRRPALRPAQARRARPRPRPGTQGPTARRTDGWDEPGGKGGHGPLRPRSEQPVGHHDHTDRT